MGQPEEPKLDYRGKRILAPMVRACTLPMRLLALSYGADIVYSEEIVDLKLLQCERLENSAYGTIDYKEKSSGDIVFRTHPDEKRAVVLQIGTADPDMAAQVAALVENDVAGLDINMGCPKNYSVLGGMGAALLTKPDLVEKILRAARAKFSKSLTCKIRLLPNVEDTVALVKRIAATGVDAIAVHGRTKDERPRHKNRLDVIAMLAKAVDIPVIANGSSADVHSFEDMEKFLLASGASSVMIARSVQRNPSLFRREGKLPKEQIILDYLKKSIHYDRNFRNSKYSVQHFFGDTSTELGQRLLATRDFRELCQVFQMEEYDDEQLLLRGIYPDERPGEKARAAAGTKRLHEEMSEESGAAGIMSESLDYEPIGKRLKKVKNSKTPKSLLLEHCVREGIAAAHVNFSGADRGFRGSIVIDGRTFTSTVPHKTKKDAEQACMLVALKHLIKGFEI
ncbi:tRNA-dihydrouridine(20) synthase [NAD(P)+]-like [Hypsibius exemplaris]|uniref:tRNA-dihydrouridine(20) synthase [NAD(P)+]-like n=2 Tax=Hypsibius TaxID=58670 RepID=A0A1W0X0Z9_HYPEX|nr:putative tRNA-dihydrouridine synthase 2-like protein [Hypsibius dujardini]OQV21134.1 tRNA-dihydrouridine(20) synthase [NAD(P)+]-like [Hypsibius exemplaris]